MKQAKITKNYIYQSLANLISLLVPLIMTPYLARVLGPEGIGISSYTGSVVAAFGIFLVLGAHDYGRLLIAECGDNLQQRSKVFWEIFLCKLCASLFILPLYFLYTKSMHRYADIFFLQSIFLLSCFTDTTWVYQGMEDFRQLAARTIITRIGSIFLILLYVRGEGDLKNSLLIGLLTTLVSNLLLFFHLRHKLCWVKLSKLAPQNHAKNIVSFFLPILAAQLYLHIDKIMLGRFAVSIAESGYYEQSRKVAEIITTLVVTINSVMVPRIAYLYARKEHEQIKQHYQDSFYTILMLALPAAAGLYMISNQFVLWFFGNGYDKVAVLMKFSSAMILFSCVGNFVSSQYLIPTRQQNKATVIYAITACVNILLNSVLIPRLLSVGAMVASLVAEGLSGVLQMRLLLKSPYHFPLFEGGYRIVIGTLLMGCTVWGIQHTVSLPLTLMLFVEVMVGVGVYGLCLVAMKDPIILKLIDKELK